MKQFYLIIGLLFLNIFAFAQVTNTFPATGYVGIGTTNPMTNFHVMQNLQQGEVRIGGDNGPGNGRIFIQADMLNNNSYIDAFGDNAYKKLSIEALPLILNSRSFGNVGIGTDDPTNTLTLRRTALGTSNDVGIDFSATNGTYHPVYARIALGVGTAVQDQGTGYLSFSTLNSGTLIESMRIDPAGNVGIGTSNPTSKLAVNGKIRAQEIKVEAASWPDYVFEKDYQLSSLKEIEDHIKEKGHLPGIPSAEKVKSNGIDLGEMNAKLLQKIEELTLHLIEMEKKCNIQQKLNEKQNKEFSAAITELKSKIKYQK